MAFMVPVVKNDYDIYSKSPPKNKPIVSSNNGKSRPHISRRQQSNSISIAVLQHNQQKQSQRIHSKSVTEPSIQNERQRSTSSSSTSHSSSESLELIRKMINLISFDSSKDSETRKQSKSSNQSNHPKTHWSAKIFRKRGNSLSSHKIS